MLLLNLKVVLTGLLWVTCTHAGGASKTIQALSRESRALPKLRAPEAYSRAIAYHRERWHPPRGIYTEDLSPDLRDAQYFIQVEIGTPAQVVSLILDTLSSDLWVFSPQLPDWQETGHKLYDPSLSSTSKALSNTTWSIRYPDGSTSNGDVLSDRVKIGGLTALNQSLSTPKNVSKEFYENARADGIVGFGFSSRNRVKPRQNVWFDNVKGALDEQIFTLDIRHSAPSTIDFGFINKGKHLGDISYTPISATRLGLWSFQATGYKWGNQSITNKSIEAIADSGTTFILIEDAILEQFYAGVPGTRFNSTDQHYIFPCDVTLPDFEVFIRGGYSACVPAAYLNWGPTDYAPDMCYGSLQSNVDLGLSILGDVFLKSQFVVYDSGNKRLGFAPKHLIF